MECTLRKLKQKSLTKAGERATSAEDCRRVSVGVSVQQYSVQCKGYNLIGVSDGHSDHEAVHLTLRQAIGAVMLHRILGSQNSKLALKIANTM